MLHKMPVAHLFGLISLGGCLVLGGVLGSAAVLESREAERHSAISRLEAVERSRLTSIRNYLEYVEDDVHLLAHSTAVIHAIERFHEAWMQMPGAEGAEIRRLYREENPYEGAERINLVDADCLFKLLDTSGDGLVDMQTFIDACKVLSSREKGPPCRGGYKSISI